jgi:hypothetical protein
MDRNTTMTSYPRYNGDNDDNCVICSESLDSGSIFQALCKHSFHLKCIMKNIRVHNYKCPLCRADLDLTEFGLEATPSHTENDVCKQLFNSFE